MVHVNNIAHSPFTFAFGMWLGRILVIEPHGTAFGDGTLDWMARSVSSRQKLANWRRD